MYLKSVHPAAALENFLKSQVAAQSTIPHHERADFWEFSPVEVIGLICICVIGISLGVPWSGRKHECQRQLLHHFRKTSVQGTYYTISKKQVSRVSTTPFPKNEWQRQLLHLFQKKSGKGNYYTISGQRTTSVWKSVKGNYCHISGNKIKRKLLSSRYRVDETTSV